jgi:hypothetical protein
VFLLELKKKVPQVPQNKPLSFNVYLDLINLISILYSVNIVNLWNCGTVERIFSLLFMKKKFCARNFIYSGGSGDFAEGLISVVNKLKIHPVGMD